MATSLDANILPPSARVDRELADVLAALPKGPNGLFDLEDLPGTRAALDQQSRALRKSEEPDPNTVIRSIDIPGADGRDLTIRLFSPKDAEQVPALLWFHGGGQVMGAAWQEDGFLERLCQAIGCVIASVDYRLAPEWRAPAAAEDGYLAYTWLNERANEFGIDRARMGIAGASGGGAIAAATALMVRDRGAPTPRLLSLSYPMLDDRNETASSREITDLGIWDRRTNLLAWQAVLGDDFGCAAVTPYQAAGRATDLSNLPPTFVAVGELDVFRDEDVAFATRQLSQGVSSELHVFAGAYHGFDLFARDSALAKTFLTVWHGFLKRHLYP